MNFVIGIDVGGQKKGFHGAILEISSQRITELFHEVEPENVIERIQKIKENKDNCQVIAIDCPPKALIKGPETRLAERELHKKGYRVLFTARKESMEQEWMSNGEELWKQLKEKHTDILCIETFPTPVSDVLGKTELMLPLKFIAGRKNRPFYKDYIDACICALVAEKSINHETIKIGEGDELGPIHIL